MPGPNVGTILTSNDVGLGTYEMKVKGTFVLPGPEKFLISKFLFTSPEEEQAFMDRNPMYKKGGFLPLNDPESTPKTVDTKPRGRNIPETSKDQEKDGIMNTGEDITPEDVKKVSKKIPHT